MTSHPLRGHAAARAGACLFLCCGINNLSIHHVDTYDACQPFSGRATIHANVCSPIHGICQCLLVQLKVQGAVVHDAPCAVRRGSSRARAQRHMHAAVLQQSAVLTYNPPSCAQGGEEQQGTGPEAHARRWSSSNQLFSCTTPPPVCRAGRSSRARARRRMQRQQARARMAMRRWRTREGVHLRPSLCRQAAAACPLLQCLHARTAACSAAGAGPWEGAWGPAAWMGQARRLRDDARPLVGGTGKDRAGLVCDVLSLLLSFVCQTVYMRVLASLFCVCLDLLVLVLCLDCLSSSSFPFFRLQSNPAAALQWKRRPSAPYPHSAPLPPAHESGEGDGSAAAHNHVRCITGHV